MIYTPRRQSNQVPSQNNSFISGNQGQQAPSNNGSFIQYANCQQEFQGLNINYIPQHQEYQSQQTNFVQQNSFQQQQNIYQQQQEYQSQQTNYMQQNSCQQQYMYQPIMYQPIMYQPVQNPQIQNIEQQYVQPLRNFEQQFNSTPRNYDQNYGISPRKQEEQFFTNPRHQRSNSTMEKRVQKNLNETPRQYYKQQEHRTIQINPVPSKAIEQPLFSFDTVSTTRKNTDNDNILKQNIFDIEALKDEINELKSEMKQNEQMAQKLNTQVQQLSSYKFDDDSEIDQEDNEFSLKIKNIKNENLYLETSIQQMDEKLQKFQQAQFIFRQLKDENAELQNELLSFKA